MSRHEPHEFSHRRDISAAPHGSGDAQHGGLQGRWVLYFESMGVVDDERPNCSLMAEIYFQKRCQHGRGGAPL